MPPAAAQHVPLRGFSGCSVTLICEAQTSYVRKAARDLAYNDRLLRQADKQRAFHGDAQTSPAPVRATGTLPSGLAYIDMDYIQGVTAAEKLSSLPLTEIRTWSTLLLHFAQAPTAATVPPAAFHAKIADLRRDLTAKGLTTNIVTQTLDRLAAQPWTGIPATPCHGDLTLENIIVHNDQLYLIDFLDSFADSWYLDIAKLLQDLIGGWSFRHAPADRNLLLRLASLRDCLESALSELHPQCLKPIHDLYALNLLRILPYSSTNDTRAFVESRLSALPF